MKQFIYEQYIDFKDKHWWFVARRKILDKIIRSFFNKSKDNAYILEVGCASGGNFGLLSKFGKLFALEMNDLSIEYAKKRNLAVVKKGILPHNIPFNKKFDLIAAFDVIEHIDDDLSAVKELVNRLNNNGIIVITVPAFKFLWGSHDVVAEHKRRYNKKMLLKLANNTGLNVLYVSYFNFFLFPIIAGIRFFYKLIKRKNKSDNVLPSNFINNLLIKIFAAERFFLPKIKFPFGVSLVLVAKKNY